MRYGISYPKKEKEHSVKVSVVVATYNGHKYIYQQLESVRMQTRQADEVIISDDNSTDDTYNQCLSYINEHNLTNWKLIKTGQNAGYYKNFMNAIENSTGDIIFLADQDDVWLDYKISDMASLMERNTQILSLASTFCKIDENGEKIGAYVKHPYYKKNGIKKISLRKFFKHPYYLGMSMAIKRELFEEIKNVDNYDLVHDIMLNLYAAQKEGFFFYDKVLTKRRYYDASASSVVFKKEKEKQYTGKKKGTFQIWIQLKHFKIMMKILQKDQSLSIKSKKLLNRFIKCCENRYDYIEKKEILKWIINIKYIRYYKSFLHYLYDLKLILNKQ